MEKFDLYLDRLTQAKVFISALPYRQNISIEDGIVLRDMLDYFRIQKMLSIEEGIAFSSEIDSIISILSERINAEIELSSDVAMLAKKHANTASSGFVLQTSAVDLTNQRARYLYEIDPVSLEDLDDMTLEELDYVMSED